MQRSQRGFGLIEIMISLLISLVSVLAVMQVFSRSEAAKRITNGNDDAQLNAMLALNQLTREIRQGGLNINSFNILGCSFTFTHGGGATATVASVGPVIINSTLIPAGDANTDTVMVIRGSDSGSPEGDLISATTTTTLYSVTTTSSFAVGDRVVAAPITRATNCAVTMAKITAKVGTSLTVSGGVAGLAVGDLVFNMGSATSIKVFAIRKGNLTVCDYLVSNCGNTASVTTLDNAVWVPVLNNIVSLRAQYARDTSGLVSSAMTGVVDTYDQITPGSTADTQTILQQCRWARIMGMRVAVTGRSGTYDKSMPTTASPTWSGSTVVTTVSATNNMLNPTAVPVTLSNLTNWQYYRYRLLESAIPLRNMIWQGSQATYQGGYGGC